MSQVLITPNGIVTDKITMGLKEILGVAQDLQASGGNPKKIAHADDILALLNGATEDALLQALTYVYVELQQRSLRNLQSIIANTVGIEQNLQTLIAHAADILELQGQLAAAIGVTVQGYDINILKSNVSRLLTAAYYSTPQALGIAGGSVAFDMSLRNVFSLSVTADFTLAYPINPAAMPGAGMWLIYATQDATGRNLSLASGYRLCGGEWSTNANQVNLIFVAAQSAAPAVLDVWIAQRGAA